MFELQGATSPEVLGNNYWWLGVGKYQEYHQMASYVHTRAAQLETMKAMRAAESIGLSRCHTLPHLTVRSMLILLVTKGVLSWMLGRSTSRHQHARSRRFEL
jgi:dTDP-glucose pyrophosphorylase